MLILTRRVGESVQIGDSIKLTVLTVRGTQVQLGVEAPPEVSVHREEVYQRIQRERGAERQVSNLSQAVNRFLGKSKKSGDC